MLWFLAGIMIGSSAYFLLPFKVSVTDPVLSTQANLSMASADSIIPFHAPTYYGISIDSLAVTKATIQRNENLSQILSRYHLPNNIIAQIGRWPKEIFNVRKIKANRPYSVIHKKDSLKSATHFIYEINPIEYIKLAFGDSIQIVREKRTVDTVIQVMEGSIDESLYMSVIKAGGSPDIVEKLASIYAWEIDFFRIQSGDSYKAAYEVYEVEGKAVQNGRILAAEFTHMGTPFEGYLFDAGEGEEYFDEAGNNLRKAFLKAPLSFTRISSRFSYSRLHPVLKVRRAHLGVDYAAPSGTPVQAVADGVVVKKGYNGGAGHMIKIRHANQFMTAYLHLSRYQKGIFPGAVVKQGDVIGYVGSTGLSTGPHLDFRVWHKGKAINPLRMQPASGDPVPDKVCEDFQLKQEELKEFLITEKKMRSI